MSTYTFCACYGCFDVTVSADEQHLELCVPCEEAGCERFVEDGLRNECQRVDLDGGEMDETD